MLFLINLMRCTGRPFHVRALIPFFTDQFSDYISSCWSEECACPFTSDCGTEAEYDELVDEDISMSAFR